VTFAAAFILSAWAVLQSPSLQVPWLLMGWALTLNGARNMALVLIQQCGHNRFTKKSSMMDCFIGVCLSTLLQWQDEKFLAELRALSTWRARLAGLHRDSGALP
jgi:hypothetical protein